MAKIPEDQIESGSGIKDWVTSEFFGKDAATVGDKVDNYRRQFPPQGYDTHTLTGPRLSSLGYWWARVRRYSTCS